MPTLSPPPLKVADEVWIATALLHRQYPNRPDFTVKEIVLRAEHESPNGAVRPGVYQHALQHCVANRPPNPGRYRMLFATGKLTRRLFRDGDLSHPLRRGAKIVPEPEEIPGEYLPLLAWYFSDYSAQRPARKKEDSILALRGLGKQIWTDEDPDEHVRRLREGWE
jgi:hypothetical protein